MKLLSQIAVKLITLQVSHASENMAPHVLITTYKASQPKAKIDVFTAVRTYATYISLNISDYVYGVGLSRLDTG